MRALFFVLSKLLDSVLSPLTWGLVLFALAIPWRTPRHPSSIGRRRAFGIAGLLVLLVFALEPVSNAILYRLEHATVSTYRPDVTYDAVILLGGVSDERVVHDTGELSLNESAERLTVTHRLLRDGHARHAIVSGAAMTPALVDSGEARVLVRQLEEWGVESSRLLLEEKARNTRENAVYSREIALAHGFTKILVVTSAFHMRRAVECFEAVGMDVDTLSADYRAHSGTIPGSSSLVPRSSFLADSTTAVREFMGLYIYRLQGYAKPRP